MKIHTLLLLLLIMPVLTKLNAQELIQVKNINPAGNSFPNNLTEAGGKLFFLAADNTGYQKLWVTQGTEATTVLLLDQILMQTQKLIAYKGKVYFDCYNATYGQEMWVTDGTVGGTHLFVDIYPGTTGSYPSAFTVTNNKLFFMGANAAGERRLFVTDGTAAGTIVLRNDYIQLFNGFSDFAVLNNEIYFTSGSLLPNYTYAMWKSNGTVAGTVMLVPGIISTIGGNSAVLNNKMYFTAADDTHGTELWVTNGSTLGTYMVKNIYPDPPGGGVFYSGAPQHITVYKSKLYFFASDDTHGQELYTSDGTAVGTVLVKDILPGGSCIGSEIAIYNGEIYFTCNQLAEMWKCDGTAAGTQFVKNNMYDYTQYSAIFNNKMYITSRSNYPVKQSDGTTAETGGMTAANTVNEIDFYSADQHFTQYNGALYFSGACGGITQGFELCKLTATQPTTFSFTGNGNWSNPANWAGGIVPPATLPAGSTVIINGACILDVPQRLASGSTLIVAAGKSLVIMGSLTST